MFVPVPSFLPPKRFPIPMVLVLTLLSEWRLFLFGRLLLCTARQLRAEPSPPLVKVSVFFLLHVSFTHLHAVTAVWVFTSALNNFSASSISHRTF